MLTACIALGAGTLIASFAAGFWVGGDCAALSARERIAAAYRAQDRAIRAAEDAQAEVAHWRDVAASPATLWRARA